MNAMPAMLNFAAIRNNNFNHFNTPDQLNATCMVVSYRGNGMLGFLINKMNIKIMDKQNKFMIQKIKI